MKLKTHASTAIALTYMLDYYVASISPDYASATGVRILVYVTAAALQYIIDNIGHTWVRSGIYRFPKRNKLHSLPAMIAIGLGVGVAYAIATNLVEVLVFFPAVMLLHWLEDLVTEGGVYLYQKRIRLPFRVRYDNVLVNRGTILFFALLIVTLTNPFESPQTLFFFAVTLFALVQAFLTV